MWYFPLLVLLIPGAVLAILRYSRLSLGRREKIIFTLLRTVVLVLLAIAIADIKLPLGNSRLSVAILVDVSRSCASEDESLSAASRYIDKLPDDAVWCLISFAAEPSLEIPPTTQKPTGRLRLMSEIDRDRTDIEAAVRLAMSILPRSTSRKILILSDGNENLGHLEKLIPLIEAEGIEVFTLGMTADHAEEALLHPNVRSRVSPSGTVEVTLLVHSTVDQSASITADRDGAIEKEVDVNLRMGINPIKLTLMSPEAGNHQYRFYLRPDRDINPQNNMVHAEISVSGETRVAYVGRENDGRFFVELGRKNRFEVERITPEQLPETAAELAGFRAIIIDNLPADTFPTDQMQAVESFVKDSGGGLILLGGADSFGAGGYFDTPIAKISPVEMYPRNREQRLALVILLDKSGSMEKRIGTDRKLDLALAATEAAVRSLRERDMFGLILFDAKATELFRLGKKPRMDEFIDRTSGIRAGSGTDLYPALKRAEEWLADSDVENKLVIIVSDGRSRSDVSSLADEMSRKGVVISTIAIGDSDRATLAEIARIGRGTFSDVRDMSQLPRVFNREVRAGQRLISETETATVPLGHRLTAGIGDFPPTSAHNLTSPKDGSSLVLRTSEGDPILAVWQYGLGKVAAFTSRIGGTWGEKWQSWDNLSRFWMRIISWVGNREAGNIRLDSEISGGRGIVHLEIGDQRGMPLSGMLVGATVVHPDGEVAEISFDEISAGVYEATFDMPDIGRYVVTAVDRSGRDFRYLARSTVHMPYSPESVDLSINERLLKRISSGTGGMFGASPETLVSNADRRRGEPRSLWQWLLVAATCLFILELALRKSGLVRKRQMTVPEMDKSVQSRDRRSQTEEYAQRLLRLRGEIG